MRRGIFGQKDGSVVIRSCDAMGYERDERDEMDGRDERDERDEKER